MATPKPVTRPRVKDPLDKGGTFATSGGGTGGGRKPKGKPKGNGGNTPQSMFPSSDLTAQEMARILGGARTQVNQTYAASPLPSLQTYQQPFIDAANHEAKLGNDMLAAIGSAATYSAGQTQGMSDWIQQNIGGAAQQAQAAAGPGNNPVPQYTTAAQSALPIQSMGTSQTQYLNALAPYVAGSAQGYQRQITTQQNAALKDYNQAVADRSSSKIKDTQDLYQTNLKSAVDVRQNVTKNAIAEYIALTSAGMKADAAAEKVRKDTADILRDIRAGDIAQQNADAHDVTAAASDYRAHHPSSSSTTPGDKYGKLLSGALAKASKAYGTKLGNDTPLQNYTRQIKVTYTGQGFGGSSNPNTTFTATVNTTDPNDPEIQKQFAAWKAQHPEFPGASMTDRGSPVSHTVPGAVSKNYPGLGTNWQNGLTAFAAAMASQKKPNETPQQFRSRMAAIYAGYQPRPKGK